MRTTIWAILAAALLAAGCKTIRYEMRPPASDAGRQCVTHCAAIRESCRGNEIRRARLELESCESRAEQTFRSCLVKADSADKRKDCEKRKSGCWAHESTTRCDDEYRTCFGQCGGAVIRHEE